MGDEMIHVRRKLRGTGNHQVGGSNPSSGAIWGYVENSIVDFCVAPTAKQHAFV